MVGDDVKNQDEFEQNFPSDKYEKSTFTFTKAELALVNTYQSILTMGTMARVMLDNMINGVCLPRVGIDPNAGVGSFYDNTEGIFVVYKPKHPCVTCKKKPGAKQIGGQWYCDIHAKLVEILPKEETK